MHKPHELIVVVLLDARTKEKLGGDPPLILHVQGQALQEGWYSFLMQGLASLAPNKRPDPN